MCSKILLSLIILIGTFGCTSPSRTAKITTKEDYETRLDLQYPRQSKEDAKFNEGIGVLTKDLIKVLQRNDQSLYDVTVEEFISQEEYAPGKAETSTFGRILAERIASELIAYSDTLERAGSKINIAVEVIKRADIKRFDFIEESQKRRIDGSVRIIISGTYHEMTPPIMAIEATVYSSQTAVATASSSIRIPVPTALRWETTSDQYIYRLDHKN